MKDQLGFARFLRALAIGKRRLVTVGLASGIVALGLIILGLSVATRSPTLGIAAAAPAAQAPTSTPGTAEPGSQRGSGRAPREVAADLDARLQRLETAHRQHDASGAQRARQDVSQAADAALADLDGQVYGSDSLVVWAASIAKDAADRDDDLSAARARRYLAGALGTAPPSLPGGGTGVENDNSPPPEPKPISPRETGNDNVPRPEASPSALPPAPNVTAPLPTSSPESQPRRTNDNSPPSRR